MKKLLLFAALAAVGFSANADYTDAFKVTYNGAEVATGATLICTEYEDYTDLDDGYSYESKIYVDNMKFGSQTVTGTLLWGSYPTKEEFLSRMDEMIPGTYLPVFGTVQLCNLDGNCFGNLSDDFIGQGPSTLGMTPGGFWIHLNQATPELVSEYVLKIESQSDPEAVFECKIVFARSQEAAEEFIAQAGVSAIVDDAEVAPVYYNLNGQRVENPDKGIYIIRQGNKVSKVIL